MTIPTGQKGPREQILPKAQGWIPGDQAHAQHRRPPVLVSVSPPLRNEGLPAPQVYVSEFRLPGGRLRCSVPTCAHSQQPRADSRGQAQSSLSQSFRG